jgi:oxygen-independent coproporphyrinogen-3 oxidase
MSVDFALIRKYDRPGPRYTSYPSAVHFAPHHLRGLRERIAANNEAPRDLSIYVHLPFCRSLCWYCGCNTVISKKQSCSAEYLQYLEREIALVSGMTNPHRQVTQLHFGGGTPTFLLPSELKQLTGMLRDAFGFAPGMEAGVEIDARTLTQEHVDALREAGFNRASFGVQDDTPEVQWTINRIQPYEMTAQAVERVRAAGFGSVSFDLIYGLPRQTPESFSMTLDNVLKLQPNRLAVFSYAHVPSLKPAQKLLERVGLPGTEEKLQLLRITVEKMLGAGYVYIGMDHFARQDDELVTALRHGTLRRNFQGYSTQAPADVYGLGVSSISQIPGSYWQNHRTLPEYYASLERGELPWHTGYAMGEDDRIRAGVIMSLMCNLRVDFAEHSAQAGIDYREYFAEELDALRQFEDDELLSFQGDVLEVGAAGRFVIRSIAMQFDKYMASRPAAAYSRAV